MNSILNLLDRSRGQEKSLETILNTHPTERMNAGDLVRVRSREEIQSTLDRWGALRGCGFLNEMADYCGTTQRVLKRVERFIDERDYRLKKASGIGLLDGVICSGTSTTGRCDRSCFFFWREEWLEKLDRAAEPEVKKDGCTNTDRDKGIEPTVEWLQWLGHRVVFTPSACWYDASRYVFQAFPYHRLINPSEDELLRVFREGRAVALRYSAPLTAPT